MMFILFVTFVFRIYWLVIEYVFVFNFILSKDYFLLFFIYLFHFSYYLCIFKYKKINLAQNIYFFMLMPLLNILVILF